MPPLRRRDLLAGTALVLLEAGVARGDILQGELPWEPAPEHPSYPPTTGGWRFFTAPQAAMVEAIAERLIPPDPATPGGGEAGCAVYIDRQLAGPYGSNTGLYDRPPFVKGTPSQGEQSAITPAQLYRAGLAALASWCQQQRGHAWVQLSAAQQDEVLRGLEAGQIQLQGVNGETLFQAVLKDVKEGFFADPIYGGNRDMCAWKMIGFPGARYNYRDWVGRHNQRYPYPPVSIAGSPDWSGAA
ncbi:MAG TPA: gluconate 2-dehydrogenase subunit 3 family protein [Steroidobacteraceae bacterium]|nr:gluconate 2-dehydrogenase subunit 3 family protein [Steroidobacteraceae bacterium]